MCRHGLNGFDSACSFGAYDSELKTLIHLFKYGKVQTLAKPLGKLLSSALPRGQRSDVIVPMPLHWRRRWSRGFNQSDLLARELGRRTGLPVRGVLRRVRNTSAQAGLTNAKRRVNVLGAFRVNPRCSVAGLRVLLIDDVMTTGATAGACAAALKKAGASHVTLLTLARTDRRFVAVQHKTAAQGFPDSPLSGSFEDAKSGSTA